MLLPALHHLRSLNAWLNYSFQGTEDVWMNQDRNLATISTLVIIFVVLIYLFNRKLRRLAKVFRFCPCLVRYRAFWIVSLSPSWLLLVVCFSCQPTARFELMVAWIIDRSDCFGAVPPVLHQWGYLAWSSYNLAYFAKAQLLHRCRLQSRRRWRLLWPSHSPGLSSPCCRLQTVWLME